MKTTRKERTRLKAKNAVQIDKEYQLKKKKEESGEHAIPQTPISTSRTSDIQPTPIEIKQTRKRRKITVAKSKRKDQQTKQSLSALATKLPQKSITPAARKKDKLTEKQRKPARKRSSAETSSKHPSKKTKPSTPSAQVPIGVPETASPERDRWLSAQKLGKF